MSEGYEVGRGVVGWKRACGLKEQKLLEASELYSVALRRYRCFLKVNASKDQCGAREEMWGDFTTMGPSMVVGSAQLNLGFEQIAESLQLGSRSTRVSMDVEVSENLVIPVFQ